MINFMLFFKAVQMLSSDADLLESNIIGITICVLPVVILMKMTLIYYRAVKEEFCQRKSTNKIDALDISVKKKEQRAILKPNYPRKTS